MESGEAKKRKRKKDMADFLIQPTLKLLIDRRTNKVLYGEANKDMVDFLFAILAFPLGHATELLTPKGMVGSIGNLYKSLKDLPNELMQPDTDKNNYLKPKLSIPTISPAARLLGLQEGPTHSSSSSRTSGLAFGSSSRNMGTPVFSSSRPFQSTSVSDSLFSSSFVFCSSQALGVASGGGEGCVKGGGIYMVMDNLEVKPMSHISSVTLLKHVKDLSALMEKEVEVGTKEGLAILKASLESTTVLTDVFGEKLTSIVVPIPDQI